MDETIQFASENGYVETLFGRRCYVSGFDSSAAKGFAARAAINAPIQGGSADITKKAMIEIQKQLENRQMKSEMLLQVHDELVFEVPEDEIEQMKVLVKNTMENVVQLSVPLVVDIGIGKNWKEAH
jgi:DNA polymerase-1